MPQYFAFRTRNSKKRKRGTADRVAKHNIGVVFEYMGQEPTIAERIQTLVAKILATSPAGHQLCLIGGFRYRLRLNAVETRQRQPRRSMYGSRTLRKLFRSGHLLPETVESLGRNGHGRAQFLREQ